MARESFSRKFENLVERGIVNRDGPSIVVMDMAMLMKFSGMTVGGVARSSLKLFKPL